MEAIRLLDLKVDVLHANDWQTGLLPAYLKIEYRIRSRATADRQPVHRPQHGLPGPVLALGHAADRAGLEIFQLAPDGVPRQLNLLKTGMVFADSINTVSPRYAQEIQPRPWAAGWKACCSTAATCFRGFSTGSTRTNGTRPTTRICRPTTTRHRSRRASRPRKAALQKELGLPQDPRAPLVGMVGRLTDQKGLDLVADVIQDWVQTSDVQWVILGTGQPKYHQLFETIAERFRQKVAVRLGVLQSPGPSHRGGGRPVLDAQPFRALRTEPDVQPEVRHGAAWSARPAAWPIRSSATTRWPPTRPRTASCSTNIVRWP